MADSLTQTIVEKAIAGTRPMVIHHELNGVTSLAYIYHIISTARAAGADIPRFSTRRTPGLSAPRRRIRDRAWLPQSALDRLDPHAAARGIELADLIQRIVLAVAEHELVDAVLDDREASP